jgi:hypothetical protein
MRSCRLTKTDEAKRLIRSMKRHAEKPVKKKFDYPEASEADRMAAELRQRCNKLTREQREELSKRAMQIYYGGSWPKEAARS